MTTSKAKPARAEIGRHLDLSTRAVDEMVRRGVLPRAGGLDECRVAYLRHLRKAASGRDSATSRARARKLTAEAKMSEMRAEVMAGTLGDLSIVEEITFKLARQDRDALLALPPRVAPEIAAQFNIDPTALAIVLDKHIRDHLDEISRDAMAESEAIKTAASAAAKG